MPIRVAVGFLVAALSLSPPAALAQRPVELAFAHPQPHFVAAWAPKKPREAERSAVLVQRVSLELADVPLNLALKTLTQRAELNITYSPAVLPVGKRVTFNAGDIAVVTALTEMLFKSGLDVMVDRDGAMALVVCRHPAPRAEILDSGTIVGTVTDKATGAPLAGATVLVEGTSQSATTNSEGQYRIEGVEPGTHSVRARYIGYSGLGSTVTLGEGEELTADFSLQKSVQRLDELVTTGTVVPTQMKALPTPMSVIRASDVAELRPQTVGQLLRQMVPTALGWDRPQGPYYTSFAVRGASTLAGEVGQMKVLVDGVEVASPSLAAVDPNTIERMEVIRGPQAAAIYGSDAMGGVIQIFTKRGDSTLTQVLVEAETAVGVIQTPYVGFNGVVRQNYIASVSGGRPTVSYHVGGGYTRTGDYLPDGEISRQSTPSFHGGVRLTHGRLALDVSGRYYVENAPAVINPELSQTGVVSFSRPFYQPQQIQNQTLGFRIGLAPRPWWNSTVSAGIDRVRIELIQSRPRFTTPDDSLLFISDQTRTKTSVGINTTLQAPLTRDLTGAVAAGVDHYSLPISQLSTSGARTTTGTIVTASGSSISASRSLTDNTGYFLQGQMGFRDALFLTVGVRAEHNTDFGDSLGTPLSPRMGLSYAQRVHSATVKFRASFGRAIRAPLPGQKLGRVSSQGVVLSNSELGPERQDGWDAGIDAVLPGGTSFALTYYNQTAKGLIQTVQLPTDSIPIFQNQNVGRVKNTGVELEANVSMGGLLLRGQYGYARSRVAELAPGYSGELQVGDQTLGTPRHTAGAFASVAPFTGLIAVAGLTYAGSWSATDFVALFRCFGDTGPCESTSRGYIRKYAGFIKINASVTQQLSPHISAFVAANNLTNNQAHELDNSGPVMGRMTTVGIRFRR